MVAFAQSDAVTALECNYQTNDQETNCSLVLRGRFSQSAEFYKTAY